MKHFPYLTLMDSQENYVYLIQIFLHFFVEHHYDHTKHIYDLQLA